jgi:hypothetical protein
VGYSTGVLKASGRPISASRRYRCHGVSSRICGVGAPGGDVSGRVERRASQGLRQGARQRGNRCRAPRRDTPRAAPYGGDPAHEGGHRHVGSGPLSRNDHRERNYGHHHPDYLKAPWAPSIAPRMIGSPPQSFAKASAENRGANGFQRHQDVQQNRVVSLCPVIRDEGVAGSNPATPTNKSGTWPTSSPSRSVLAQAVQGWPREASTR